MRLIIKFLIIRVTQSSRLNVRPAAPCPNSTGGHSDGERAGVECGPGYRLRQAQSDFQAVKKFNRTTRYIYYLNK